MKRVAITSKFEKAVERLVLADRGLEEKIRDALSQFPEYKKYLNDHPLEGKLKGLRAFYIDVDCRIVYRETEIYFLLINIGTHDQVYIR